MDHATGREHEEAEDRRSPHRRGLGFGWRRFVRAPRLIGRLARLGMMLSEATGDFTRRALEANPGASGPPEGFDPGRAMECLVRAIGWAGALRARLRRELRAYHWLSHQSLMALARWGTGPENEADDYAALAAIHEAERRRSAARGTRAAARAANARFREEIAQLSNDAVLLQIGADLTEVAGMIGQDEAARCAGELADQTRVLLAEPVPEPVKLSPGRLRPPPPDGRPVTLDRSGRAGREKDRALPRTARAPPPW